MVRSHFFFAAAVALGASAANSAFAEEAHTAVPFGAFLAPAIGIVFWPDESTVASLIPITIGFSGQRRRCSPRSSASSSKPTS